MLAKISQIKKMINEFQEKFFAGLFQRKLEILLKHIIIKYLLVRLFQRLV